MAAVETHDRLTPIVRSGAGAPTRHGLDPVRTVTLAAAVVAIASGVGGVLGGGALGPLAVALVVGLPHGAVDHLAIAKRVAGAVGWALGTVGYAGMALATFLLLRSAPLVGWSAFLLLSALHFGTADREHLAARGGRPSWLFAVAAGTLPVAALMVRGADALRPLAMSLDPAVGVLLSPTVVSVVVIAAAATLLSAIVVEVRHRRRDAVIDLVVLAALFAFVPPLWAFGVYFGLWHAVRHIGRMVQEESPWRELVARRGTGAGLRRFALDAVGPTLIAAGAMGGLLLVASGADAVGMTAVALQETAAITFPHALTVAWLDRAR